MDFVITFFRDVLDGTVYTTVAVIAGILICSCIGYLAEQSIMKKKNKQQYEQEYFSVRLDSKEKNNIAVDEMKTDIVTTDSVPTETVSLDNDPNTEIPSQAIPELSNSSDGINNNENIGVNSKQNIEK